MPWDPKYRKGDVAGISASAIDVVVESGDSGPLTPIGVNLPNDERVRERHGSKSISLVNVMDAHERSLPESYWTEFSWTREEAERAAKWSGAASELATSLHEVIGHGSGQADPELGTSASAALRDTTRPRGDARDLVALTVPHRSWRSWGLSRRAPGRDRLRRKAFARTRCATAARAEGTTSRKTTCVTAS
jgi:dipeptidyl-peptidase-3